jgi:hypothetical protein
MAKCVLDKIQSGEYQTKLPYASRKQNPSVHAVYEVDASRLEEKFKTDALVELGLLLLWPDGSVRYKHSKADLLWEKAWSRGHAMGLNEVWIELKDLKELLSEVFPSQT